MKNTNKPIFYYHIYTRWLFIQTTDNTVTVKKQKKKMLHQIIPQICHLGPEYRIGMNFTHGVFSSKTLSQASISIGYITGIHKFRQKITMVNERVLAMWTRHWCG